MILILLLIIFSVIILFYSQKENRFIESLKRIETKNTHGYHNFITDKERKCLVDFVNQNLDYFEMRSNDKELLATIEELPDYPKRLIKKLRNRIIKKEKLTRYYPDLIHQSAVSVIYDGGFHNYHRDINYLNWILVRYNIILSKSEEGGLSVYGDEINDWEEKTIWKCAAGLYKHGVTKVVGEKPRIVLCLGFMIPLDDKSMKEKNKIVNFTKLPKEVDYLEFID